jgi:hypothetical protein
MSEYKCPTEGDTGSAGRTGFQGAHGVRAANSVVEVAAQESFYTKLILMKRTETAGNPFSRDAASRSKLKDPKFQTFTKITQLQDEETMLAKRLDMLREK